MVDKHCPPVRILPLLPFLAAPLLHSTPPPLDLELVAEGQFFSPTTVTHAGDGGWQSQVLFETRLKPLKNGTLPEIFLF